MVPFSKVSAVFSANAVAVYVAAPSGCRGAYMSVMVIMIKKLLAMLVIMTQFNLDET